MAVRGEVDFATAPILQRALHEMIDEGNWHITLDFHRVTFLDSEGLKVLIQAYKRLLDIGGTVQVQGCSKFVAKTFEILGVATHFGIDSPKTENQI